MGKIRYERVRTRRKSTRSHRFWQNCPIRWSNRSIHWHGSPCIRPLSPSKIAKAQDTRLHKTVDALSRTARMSPFTATSRRNPPSRQRKTHRIDAPSRRDGARCGNPSSIAQGAIVDEAAVVDALSSSALTSAALDVFEQEPVDPNHLCSNSNTFTVHLIGASTVEAQGRVGMDIVTNVLDILAGLPSDFVVNNEHL